MILTIKEKYKQEEKVLIKCDLGIHPKCKGEYLKVYKNVIKYDHITGRFDRCQYCFNATTKTGSQNFNYKYSKNEDYFENIDTELKAYLLGWVAGDGCLKKDGLYLSVHKNDIEIINLFKDTLITSDDANVYYRDYDNTMNIIINSVQITKDLLRHLKLSKPGKKSYDIALPDLSDELMWCFIRGLMDSDGWVKNISLKNNPSHKDKYPLCNYCSMSKDIRIQIMEFCKKYDIKTYNGSDKIGQHSLSWAGQNALKFLSKIYDGANFYLTRKYESYHELKPWISQRVLYERKK